MAGNEVKLRFYTKEVKQAIQGGAESKMAALVQEIRNITLETLSGRRTGRTYRVPGTSRTYTASSPGEPPAQATGGLRQSIATEVKVEGREVTGRVGTGLEYGKCLEFGTRNMRPRPWLKVSFEKAMPKIRSILGSRWFS